MTTDHTGAADVIPKANGSGRRIDPVVFYVGAGLVLAFVLWGALATGGLDSATASALDWVLRSFGWVFVVAAIAFLTFSLYLDTSRYGRNREASRTAGGGVATAAGMECDSYRAYL